MICLSEGFLCLVLSSWAICLASLSLALWVVFRSSCMDAQVHKDTAIIVRINYDSQVFRDTEESNQYLVNLTVFELCL